MFQDIRAFQELTGHYDAMTLQGGIGALTVASGGKASDKQKTGFKGAQYFKTDAADPKGKRAYVWETGGLAAATNVLPPGAWYCSDVSDAEECKKIAIDANNWHFAA